MKNLYEFLFDRTLSQSAMNRSQEDINKTIYSQGDTLLKISYSINEHGYRSESFNKDNEVLVLGCSQTYGSGLSNEFTWPDIFSKSFDKKYSRIAYPGDSINGQVYKAFNYFKEIGNPKVVLALFPLYRLEYPAVPGKLIHPHGSLNTNGKSSFKELDCSVPAMAYFNYDVAQFSKVPHDPAYVIPKEFSIFYNFMFIKMLEQYCESNNIKFIWSIYDEFDTIHQYLEDNLNQVLKNFLKTSDLEDSNKYERDEHKVCGLDFIDHKLFNWAADYDDKKKIGHWGIHTHQHMAERFIERYKEINND